MIFQNTVLEFPWLVKSRGIDSISSRREAALDTQTNRKRKQPHPGSSQSSTDFRPIRDPIEPLRQPEICKLIWIESFAVTIHSRRYQHWALEVDRPPLIIGEHFWDGKSFRNQHDDCTCNSFIVETLFCLWKTFRGTKISIFCLAIYILA